jgi:hypothetical protein
VKIYDQGNKSAGRHTLKVDVRALPGGTYFVVLETQEKRMTEKMVVVR